TAFAMLVEMMDIQHLYSLYKKFGLCKTSQISPAIVLGGHQGGVSLLSLAAAYRSIANGSSYIYPRIINYIEFFDGSFFPFHRSQEKQLVHEYKAMSDLQLALLNACPSIGESKLSGKTGTTRKGSLFASYNDKIAAAIWIGYEKPIAEGNAKAIGAVSVYERFMNKLKSCGSDSLSI
ncbi:MAG: penicillin-binding transpeptidase domain-containing protein, partial [Chlamydiota bacterium]|nr:penicillin-binding transpeptidase domain-containing protein [Chlamydiota bacterium]